MTEAPIPQDVLNQAPNRISEALEDYFGARCPDHDPHCPCCQAWGQYDALMAAKAEEREACALLADVTPIGGLVQTNETDLKRLWKYAGSAQAGAIAAAIRKRAEVSTAHKNSED